ncbi:MAG: hypothetical protein JWN46_3465 [Acidimicrobiales bacterium]|nr:hypothetical protein [Acidimicrobiales bacterium]
MQNRALTLVLAGLLTVGAVAGCSKSSKASSATTSGSTATTAASGGGGGATSDKVKAYCDSVDAFVAKAKSVGTDPSKLAGLTKESQDLAAAATKVATDLASDPNAATISKQITDCSAKLATAFTPGG